MVERVFVTLYGVTLLTIRLLGYAIDAHARREHLDSHEHADEELQTDRRTLVPVIISYVGAILVGLALPALAVVLYFALAVFLVVPFGEVRRPPSPAPASPARAATRASGRGRRADDVTSRIARHHLPRGSHRVTSPGDFIRSE